MNGKTTIVKFLEKKVLGEFNVKIDIIEGRLLAGSASPYAAGNDDKQIHQKFEQRLSALALRK